jgi:UDPglucose 6-dehydrogenase
MSSYRIIVSKSTVPVGTCSRIAGILESEATHEFDVVSNPDFLKEGAAVDDFMKPDRVVIGCEKESVAVVMRDLYAPFTRTGAPVLVMDLSSAEMSKYASNALLASRISYINEIANLCEHVGADVKRVREAVGLDSCVGSSFLFPGAGFGGSCFPKDVRALVQQGDQNNCPMSVMSAVEEVNERQKWVLVDKIVSFFSSTVPELMNQASAESSGTVVTERVLEGLPNLAVSFGSRRSVDLEGYRDLGGNHWPSGGFHLSLRRMISARPRHWS